MKILGVIPARYGSSRFEGKPLVDIAGKSMIRRVYEQALQATTLDNLVVATDDQRIYDHVQSFGGNVLLTCVAHPNGTSRCAEVLNVFAPDADAVINIQGDEPFIEPSQIDLLASVFSQTNGCEIATLAKRIADIETLTSPNVCKVVFSTAQKALYFSRSPIPYVRNHPIEAWLEHQSFYKHIGIYGYRSHILRQLYTLQSTSLEQAEHLEQLRWLEYGFGIHLKITDQESLAVDTPEDLRRILNWLQR